MAGKGEIKLETSSPDLSGGFPENWNNFSCPRCISETKYPFPLPVYPLVQLFYLSDRRAGSNLMAEKRDAAWNRRLIPIDDVSLAVTML